ERLDLGNELVKKAFKAAAYREVQIDPQKRSALGTLLQRAGEHRCVGRWTKCFRDCRKLRSAYCDGTSPSPKLATRRPGRERRSQAQGLSARQAAAAALARWVRHGVAD